MDKRLIFGTYSEGREGYEAETQGIGRMNAMGMISRYSSGYDVNIGNQGAWRPRLKVDNYSTFKCARFFFGKANCPRDVLVWIGDHSTMSCSGYVSDAVGTVNTLVLSNGMFSVGSGQSFTVTGTNTIVFAGRAPQLHIFGLSQGGRLTLRFDIPAEGVELSALDMFREVMIMNSGESAAGIKITMTAKGTVTNPAIYDVQTNEFFKLNVTLNEGDVVKINTAKGNKKVTKISNITETNIINLVDYGSTWLQLKTGANIFSYSATNAEDLKIEFESNLLFEGV